MPDMSGWTKEDVLAFEKMTQLNINMKGSGFVTDQSVSKGQNISKNDKVTVTLNAKGLDGESSDDDNQSSKNSSASSDGSRSNDKAENQSESSSKDTSKDTSSKEGDE